MKIKTVLFVLLLGAIALVVVGTNNSDLENATVRLDSVNNSAVINVTSDGGGDVNLTTNEILQKVTGNNIKHITVIYDNDKDGSLYISGDGKKGIDITALRKGAGAGNALRNGAGDGDAIRGGAGAGAAIRAGDGNGDAIRNGTGAGGAWRGDAGDGNAKRSSAGAGHAIRDGAGTGNAYINGVKQ